MKDPLRRRVLMLLENNPYPQDSRVRREAQTLATAGYRVAVICPAAPGQPRRETLDGVRVYRFPAPPSASGFWGYLKEYSYSMAAAFCLSLRVLVRDGFDVIHAHNPPDTFVFIAAFYKLFGKRFVYDHHDLAPEMYYARFPGRGSRLVYRLLVWCEALSCRLANHVITTNQSYKAVEMQRGRVPEQRITIVRNGPNPNGLPPVSPTLNLRPTEKTIIGYVGVIGFQDGLDYLLRALQCLHRDLGRSDFLCVLVGDGSALPGLHSLTKQLGLTEYVQFTGWVEPEDVARHLAAADICVVPDPSNPYNDRSTMIKIMEYMTLGKPVVAFDLPEHRFTAQAAALYVRPNDELEFARALAQLMDDPVRRHTMGMFGRRRIETELAWRYSAPHLLEVYQRVLAERHSQGSPHP
jgi:glycosyltransferase involved in cell wall biosynthesis